MVVPDIGALARCEWSGRGKGWDSRHHSWSWTESLLWKVDSGPLKGKLLVFRGVCFLDFFNWGGETSEKWWLIPISFLTKNGRERVEAIFQAWRSRVVNWIKWFTIQSLGWCCWLNQRVGSWGSESVKHPVVVQVVIRLINLRVTCHGLRVGILSPASL